MRSNRLWIALTITSILAAVVTGPPARAQSLGTFHWQFQPFCNVVTLTIEQKGASFVLTGHDDQCGGAAPRAVASGVAVQNPDGTIALGLTIVTPSGAAAHVNATLNLSTVSGTWRDADGNTGPFVFNPGAVSGSPRPAPTTSALITTTQIAPAAITPEKLAASIFSGTGSATTVARSDHLHDDRYYTKTQTDEAFVLRSALGPRGLAAQAWVASAGTLNFQRASNGLAVSASRLGTGLYTVTFPGFGVPAVFDQTVQITAQAFGGGTGFRSCSYNSLSIGSGNFTVAVVCFNNTLAVADASFFITVLA